MMTSDFILCKLKYSHKIHHIEVKWPAESENDVNFVVLSYDVKKLNHDGILVIDSGVYINSVQKLLMPV